MSTPPTLIPPVILFGAGASKPAGVPLAGEMTQKILGLCKEGSQREITRALVTIIGALIIGNAGDTEFDPYQVDIERVLDAAILLRDRQNLEFAPFVGAWHPVLDDLERVTVTRLDAKRIAEAAVGNTSFHIDLRERPQTIEQRTKKSVSDALSRALSDISRQLSRRPDGALFRSLVDHLTGLLVKLIWIKPDTNLPYLDPLIRIAKETGVTVATLNYDNSIESSAASAKIRCETGITYWAANGSLPEPQTSGIELLKLHGSVKWWWTDARNDDSHALHQRRIEERDDSSVGKIAEGVIPEWAVGGIGRQLGVIFGGRNKLTAQGPFLDLLARFNETIRGHQHLAVVGYSFRDEHINQCILRWLRGNPVRRITIVERPGADPKGSPLLKAVGRDAADRITFMPVGAEAGLASILS